MLSAYATAARKLGLDPYHMLRRAGVPVSALDHPENKIPVDRIQTLLADSAKAAACEDFGLIVGRAFKLSMKGPLGLLMREQASVRDAASVLERYSRYQNENIDLKTAPAPDGLMLRLALLSGKTQASALMADFTVASHVEMFRGLLGDAWKPVRTAFAHPAPRDPAPYLEQFGEVAFGAGYNGFVIGAEALGRALPESDPNMAREIARYIEATMRPAGASVTETVGALILQLLPEGHCGVDNVAQHLGVDRRTVHRRLAAEGHSFSELLDQVRRELASDRLKHGDLPLSQVTLQLGFSSLSAFSRWFRHAYGVQPSEYRRKSRAA